MSVSPKNPTTAIADLIKQYFLAYEAKDRAALEALLSDDFTFTSPLDRGISRKRYFERCWPNSGHHRSFHLENLFAQHDDAFVTYECERTDGVRFRNTEYFQARGGKIRSVEVFFGSETSAATGEREIRTVMDRIAQACRTKDAAALIRHYAPYVIAFDLIEPLEYHGVAQVKKRAEQWFSSFAGSIDFEMRDLRINADVHTAFCHSLNHVVGVTTEGRSIDMWWRASVCLVKPKDGGEWSITHIHSSVPFDMETGLASLDLRV